LVVFNKLTSTAYTRSGVSHSISIPLGSFIPWTFVIAYSKTKLNSNGGKGLLV
jgi:hypothetical protein